jgi:hypothetical protein
MPALQDLLSGDHLLCLRVPNIIQHLLVEAVPLSNVGLVSTTTDLPAFFLCAMVILTALGSAFFFKPKQVNIALLFLRRWQVLPMPN